ncbi:hypothetical protein [Embleya sp. NBC_00896]|uniref:hypothetical protein n=1 Tax=Embleya sp. NBC_00896 TaxID=2975961 RepID=UPI002F90A06F|nr:hypothetical protein OG928_41390 [Embleya sp. NBC_00896]
MRSPSRTTRPARAPSNPHPFGTADAVDAVDAAELVRNGGFESGLTGFDTYFGG